LENDEIVSESPESREVSEVVEVSDISESSEPSEPSEIVETSDIEDTSEESQTSTDDLNLGEFRLTAYCSCEKCCGKYALNRPLDENGNQIVYTASGAKAVAGYTIAVDPSVIPYGTEVSINGHIYCAHDTGGAIKGNRIDVYFDSHEEACEFGAQYANVYLVEVGK
jgi:3D (Asp-Asp-Asp) domain-containing protein